MLYVFCALLFFFFSSRRRHTRLTCDWSSDVCSSDLPAEGGAQWKNHFTWKVPQTITAGGSGEGGVGEEGRSRGGAGDLKKKKRRHRKAGEENCETGKGWKNGKKKEKRHTTCKRQADR